MSFFNKIWKNLLEKPPGNSKKPSKQSKNNTKDTSAKEKLSQKCVTFYSEISLVQPTRENFREQLTFYDRSLPVLKSHKENVSPNDPKQIEQIIAKEAE